MTRPTTGSASGPPSNRPLGSAPLLLLGVAVIGGAALLSRRYLAVRSPAPPSPAAAVAPPVAPPLRDEAATFQVTSATGTVEVERAGRWASIKNGDTLTRADVVRTAAGGRAVLRLSAGTEIELRERVEIGLDRLPSGATVDLRRGKVVARVSGAEGLEITAHDTKTANEGPAHFVVLSDDKGRVSVAALAGKARFTAGGKSTIVPEGSASTSIDGSPPSDPERIPEDVLLDVVWPASEQRHTVARAEVRGTAAPSSTVTVNGAPAPVGADGHFTATVPLGPGKNGVDVDAEDLAGRTRRVSTTVVRRSPPPPPLAPEATDLWKK